MIPTRWSSAIAILRRRLQMVAEERRLLLEMLRHAERDRIDAPAADRDGWPPSRFGRETSASRAAPDAEAPDEGGAHQSSERRRLPW